MVENKPSDFLGSNKSTLKENMKEDFDNGKHIQWIVIRFQLIEFFLKSLLFTVYGKKFGYGEDWIKFHKELMNPNGTINLAKATQIAFYLDIIDINLKKRIDEFRKKRNVTMHNLFTHYQKKVEKIDLSAFFGEGEKISDELNMIIHKNVEEELNLRSQKNEIDKK